MIFAEMSLDEAEGAILAYPVMAEEQTLRKGTMLNRDQLMALRRSGVSTVLAARFEAGDIGENEAARKIGGMLLSGSIQIGAVTTGRVNLFARVAGVFCADAAGIDAINIHDPCISLATVRNHARVETGQMVATVKIIPFAIPEQIIEDIGLMLDGRPVIDVKSFRKMRVGLIQSRLPSIREPVLDKTCALMTKRANRNDGKLVSERRVPHDADALASAITEISEISDIIVIFSASAVADAADVVPRSIRLAKGEILRIGIPVDPGNLLVLGRHNGKYIIAAPGSARSARENSLDWVLDRLMAGIELDAADLSKMGVGGLVL
ncbi:molybdopterin-binding protein [Ochrobactrum sp. CM-21-5]|nr:molybdopterin-binding protein [Ochrobactrum sp. CM-21-5]